MTPVMVDPVQSVGVAQALARRYYALSQASQDSDVELTIGEARQIYPEIWHHLDSARLALHERGVDGSAYDQLRRQELQSLGVDVEITSIELYTKYGAKIGEVYKKTASFDVGGAQRAMSAAAILKQMMPEVDWAARAREEDRVIQAAGSLKSARLISIAKVLGAGAAIALVALVAFQFLSDKGEEVANTPVHRTHVVETPKYAGPPDPVKLAARPQCDKARPSMTTRLVKEHELVRDKQMALNCEGILIDNQPVAFAVSVHAKSKSGALTELRGVVSLDGAHDLKPFVPVPPGTYLAYVGDLDRDTSDELVFVGDKTLVITRMTKDGFVDVPGPAMPEGCSADAKVSGDYRNGREGITNVLILTAPDYQTGAGCLSPGKHYFKLDGDKLVEN